MAAAAVRPPTTAQERVLAFNNPPPPPPPPPEPSHRQRAAVNNRGSGVAVNFYSDAAVAAPPPEETHYRPRRTKQGDSSDVILGPRDPGHVKHGVRRYEDKYGCMVGKALTEEWILGRKEDDPITKLTSKSRGPKDNLEGLACSIRTEEPKHRPLRAPGLVAPPHTTVAPYSEPELPPQPLPAEAPSGKRRFKNSDNGDILSSIQPQLYGAENGKANSGPKGNVRTRRNRANESHDVLNLGQYTSEELNEVERKIMHGPREFIPPPLPPRQRPIIARLKSNANTTHDIFGTGQGVDEAGPVHRKNRGASAPKRTGGADLFNPVPEEQKPVKPHQPSDFLAHYYAPSPNRTRGNADQTQVRSASAGATARQPEAKVPAGMLFVSKSDGNGQPSGRGRGMYAPKTSAPIII